MGIPIDVYINYDGFPPEGSKVSRAFSQFAQSAVGASKGASDLSWDWSLMAG